MVGFEIKIDDRETVYTTSEDVVNIFLSFDNIRVTGLDSKYYHLSWLNRKLEKGDKIKVRVTEIKDEISQIIDKKPYDREELKENYFKLREELKNKGVI